MKEVPEDIQKLLKEVVKHFDLEDRAVRERQIRQWRRLKLFWEGFQRAWYSETAHDWRVWDEVQGDDIEQAYYDKPINVFRAYLESIIAALSVVVPPVKCYPDDADSTLDLATAKAGDKIAELIYRHNDVSLLWLHALFIYCTEGMVACYSYPKEDEKFGTYEEKEQEDFPEQHQIVTCPQCGFQIDDRTGADIQEIVDKVEDEFNPDADDIPIENYLNATPEQDLCPACMQMIDPEIQNQTLIVTRIVGTTTQPKSRVCMEAYGGLYVKIPNYTKKQEDCPYLKFSYETHYSNAVQRYSHLHSKLTPEKIKASSGPKDPYEQWGRLSPQYQGEYPINNVTVGNTWLRPAAFNVLGSQDDVNKLKKKYPAGAKVVLINDEFAEASPEALDDYWTLTVNPLSDYLHHDPLGMLLVSIQEITNDLVSLTIQTIEHGIPQTFADPGVLNFNAYRQIESIPGGIYEASPKSGKSIGDAFHEVKTASLSPEVMPFGQNIQNLGQLVSGATPSIFGGSLQGVGGETASGYSMSRAQALQRLQNTWKMFTVWWKTIFGKAIPMYIELVQEDERDVRKTNDGSFINVFIRKAELEGKIGKVELEANENLPLTWSQKKDVVMQLLQAGNPEVLAILGSPENLNVIREVIGINEFFVPGEDQREKTNEDIKQLLNSEPIPTGDMMNPEVPSVEPDPIFDDPKIAFEIIRKWVISEAGRQAKVDNEAGYHNVLLFGKMYQQIMNPPMAPAGGGATPPEKPTQPEMQPEAPITGEGNVQTIQ